MTGHVYHVIDAAQDAEVAVGLRGTMKKIADGDA
jgi:hypothetical protein